MIEVLVMFCVQIESYIDGSVAVNYYLEVIMAVIWTV